MTKAKTKKEIKAVEEEVYPLVYNQYVTIQDNHGTINFDQTGKPVVPPNPPPQ